MDEYSRGAAAEVHDPMADAWPSCRQPDCGVDTPSAPPVLLHTPIDGRPAAIAARMPRCPRTAAPSNLSPGMNRRRP